MSNATIGPATLLQAISAKRAEAAERRREADLLEAEARGMEAAIAFMPGGVVGQIKADWDSAYRGGRQRGALSTSWRNALAELYGEGGAFDAAHVAETIHRLEGRSVKNGDVGRQLKKYAVYGFVQSADGGKTYSVTESAARRFGFRRLPEQERSDASNENGPPEGGPDANQAVSLQTAWPSS